MASRPHPGSGRDSSNGSKVYSRKSLTKPQHPHKKHQQKRKQPPPRPPLSSQHSFPAAPTDDANSSLHPAPPDRLDYAASNDGSSSPDNAGRTHHHRYNQQRNSSRLVSLDPGSRSKDESRELRFRLKEELLKVRALVKRLETREIQLAASSGPVPAATGYSYSQVSGNTANFEVGSGGEGLRRQLSVQAENTSVSDGTEKEKEKRAPKVNKMYRSSDVIPGKEKFKPPDSHKRMKANTGKKHASGEPADCVSPPPVSSKLYVQAFKNCAILLSKLMKHKHGWVFNTPVDAKALGLHDYYSIIKRPMDLGTVMSRLEKNWYKSPREFAEDVRLTFQNAMIYNPKGQDVYVMAEQLLRMFEERWPAIEVEFAFPSSQGIAKKTSPPLDMRRVLERSDSTTHPVVPDSTPKMPKSLNHTPHIGRAAVLKKPKARDPHKRDMTYDEKQRLSNNLQNLPSEKLENVVQIIKKRNSSLSQHDNEIEVDIDSVDIETLWELDRFVTNYKKSISKNKRKAEPATKARAEPGQSTAEMSSQNQTHDFVEPPKETMTDELYATSSQPVVEDKTRENGSRSSSSSSSSSDSESSSSESDSESSSA